MNRPLLITIGITLILLMVGIWGYLLAYGTPQQTSEVFTNLGFFEPAEQEARTIDPLGVLPEPTTSLALSGSELQQLTTRAVAGFRFASSSDGDVLRYVERGTGYIFEINLTSGTEKQISPITIPQAAEAVFSPDAGFVVITAYANGKSMSTVLPSVNENGDEAVLLTLQTGATNFAFEDETHVYYSVSDTARTWGYSYNLQSDTRSELFVLPFADPVLVWGSGVSGMYAYTTPASGMEGYLYKIQNGSFIAVADGAEGLTAFAHDQDIVVSTIGKESYGSYALLNNEPHAQALFMVPEKCTFDRTTLLVAWCGAPLSIEQASYLDNWYKGVLASEDYLWSVDLESQTVTLVGDLATLAGRMIDVINLASSQEGNLLAFINKIDGALWLYRLPQE